MGLCYDCRKKIPDSRFRCDSCATTPAMLEEEKRRRPLTAWEEKKLQFYRDERKWHEDIEMRTIIIGKDGKKHSVYKDHKGKILGEVPSQPRHLRSAPTLWQPGYSSNSERIDK